MNASLFKGPLGYAVVLGVGGIVLYLLWDKLTGLAKDAADTVGGAVSGNNAVTRGTVYEGAGVAGTVGAVANTASGGLLEDVGSWIGGKIFDWTHDEYDPNAPVLQSRKQAVGDNFYNTAGRALQ